MPLAPGNSRAVVSKNIAEMVRAGYPQKQAVAASLSNARRHPRAFGGLVPREHMRKGGWWGRAAQTSTPGLSAPQPVNAAGLSAPQVMPPATNGGGGTDSAPGGSLSGGSAGHGGGQSVAEAMQSALHGPSQGGGGISSMLPSGKDAIGMAIGASGIPMGGAAWNMGNVLYNTFAGNPVSTKDKANLGFSLMGGPVGGLKGLADAYSKTGYAHAHPFASYLYGGNADMAGANLADAGYRSGVGVGPLSQAYAEMARQNNAGGAGNPAQTRADATASFQQIADAIAMGRADPAYTAGNIGGSAANTINATNNTGVPTYADLPQDIAATLRGGGYDEGQLNSYGLTSTNPTTGNADGGYYQGSVPGQDFATGAASFSENGDWGGGGVGGGGGGVGGGGGFSDSQGSGMSSDNGAGDYGGWAAGGRVGYAPGGMIDSLQDPQGGAVYSPDQIAANWRAQYAALQAKQAATAKARAHPRARALPPPPTPRPALPMPPTPRPAAALPPPPTPRPIMRPQPVSQAPLAPIAGTKTDYGDDYSQDPYKAHGFLPTTGAGRTDNIKLSVPANAYVIPADVVSSMGQGNSLAGAKMMDQIFDHYGQSQRSSGFARGGRTPSTAPAPILAAGGEYIVSPDRVARIGAGDMKGGHRNLDKFVARVRSRTVKTLRKLPGPKQ